MLSSFHEMQKRKVILKSSCNLYSRTFNIVKLNFVSIRPTAHNQTKERQETLLFKNNKSALTMQLWRKKVSEANLKPMNAEFQQGKGTPKRARAKEKIILLLDLISNWRWIQNLGSKQSWITLVLEIKIHHLEFCQTKLWMRIVPLIFTSPQ